MHYDADAAKRELVGRAGWWMVDGGCWEMPMPMPMSLRSGLQDATGRDSRVKGGRCTTLGVWLADGGEMFCIFLDGGGRWLDADVFPGA